MCGSTLRTTPTRRKLITCAGRATTLAAAAPSTPSGSTTPRPAQSDPGRPWREGRRPDTDGGVPEDGAEEQGGQRVQGHWFQERTSERRYSNPRRLWHQLEGVL